MRSKIINLSIVGSMFLIVMVGAFQVGRGRIPEEEVVRRYHDKFHVTWNSDGAVTYPYSGSNPKELYLDLMKLSLTDVIYENSFESRRAKQDGAIWPIRALTMIGLKRLDNIQTCMEDALARGVPGDFIEAGAWRGGATIFMRAILKVQNVTDRTVWVADSFEGLPPANTKDFPADTGANYGGYEVLKVSKEIVEQNFRRFGLLDNQVRFLKGWFKDTLPGPVSKLAVLRIDADMYESTIQVFEALYPKLSSGGYVIIDDYDIIPACAKAVDDYRNKRGITGEMTHIEGAVYWQKKLS
ncbi:MAG: TylF/MycF/NovP-related O-methyltransferase [Terriglobia bacterium]